MQKIVRTSKKMVNSELKSLSLSLEMLKKSRNDELRSGVLSVPRDGTHLA
jgi:hypothetical protein